jgi:hypothetical protein
VPCRSPPTSRAEPRHTPPSRPDSASGYGHPGPEHVQLLPQVQVAPDAHCRVQSPLVHDAEQVEPDAHVVRQSPFVQVTLHAPPAGHVVLQSPLEQLTVQGPEPHVLTQSTLLQEREQDPVAGQVKLQSALPHEQLALVHAQLPPSHCVGVPELLEPRVPPDDPQAGA